MKKLFLFIAANLLLQFVSAQVLLKGTVTDAETGKGIGAASVFLSNSSTGVSTNDDGNFSLNIHSAQRFEVVVSCIGYETISKTILPDSFSKAFDIQLKRRSAQLEQVIVQSYEKDGWAQWGKLFTDNLIGTGASAGECTIKNKEVIRFVYDKQNRLLTAFAFEPLQIENRYLGYLLTYDLQSFSCDMQRKTVVYTGYPLFKNLDAGENKIKKWDKRRVYAYEGSIMHFMRSVYRNTLAQEGFSMQFLSRVVNKEKQTVKMLLAEHSREPDYVSHLSNETAQYYHEIMGQSDSLDNVSSAAVFADSIAYKVDNTTAGLGFDGHLSVKYFKEKEVRDERSFNGTTVKRIPASVISLITADDLVIYADGSYYEPDSMLAEGYWGWSEKLSNLLPADYKPQQTP